MAVSRPGRGSDQFPLRLPDGLRDELKERAEKNGRSMNAEIVTLIYDGIDAERHKVSAAENSLALEHSEKLREVTAMALTSLARENAALRRINVVIDKAMQEFSEAAEAAMAGDDSKVDRLLKAAASTKYLQNLVEPDDERDLLIERLRHIEEELAARKYAVPPSEEN